MTLRIYQDAVVVMTGGASGIGKTMAQELIRRGATVILADRDRDGAEEAADAMGSRASAVACDVTDAAQVQAIIDGAFEEHGRLDYLFNNAGIGIAGSVRKYRLEHWQRVLDVNVNGVIYGIQAAYPRMIEQGFGHIVNTASMAGLLATPGAISYGTSKHAVVGLTKGLRIEAARHNVRVTALCPGFIQTPILTGGKYGGTVDPNSSSHTFERMASSFRPMDAEAFATKTITALQRNPAMLILPWWWRAIHLLYRISPQLVAKLS